MATTFWAGDLFQKVLAEGEPKSVALIGCLVLHETSEVAHLGVVRQTRKAPNLSGLLVCRDLNHKDNAAARIRYERFS
jgi:hypothetical protein